VNQAILFQQQIKSEQLADRRGVGVVARRGAGACAGLAVMFAHPETAAALSVVQAMDGEHLLNLFQAEQPRKFGRQFIARGLDHQTEFMLR
jgi:hypothetical protein